MSYVVETAIGVEDKGAAATRGWFRIDPGQCRVVLQGEVQAESLYVHARALPVYGASPLPQGGHADLCVGNENFVLAAARACSRPHRPEARALHRDQAVGDREGPTPPISPRRPNIPTTRRATPRSSGC